MFISQGDYMFPFTFTFYWVKHFYIWSYQTGAANPDGIIRFPARVLNFLVFLAGGNMAVSYFYVLISMTIIFVSFYVFARKFLDIKSRRISILGALFFALNPVFLGYTAKIGLMVGVAMLPLCLVVLQWAFAKKQFRYFILYLLLLNVALIHPFTFTVNLLASGGYALYMLRNHGGFVFAHKLRALGVLLLGVLLYAYFLLPIGALGTVNKSVLSEEITDVPVDYTALVDYANAGNPFTALSLSKDVFLDFRYYNVYYRPLYMGAVFIFYLVLFGLYLYNEKRLGRGARARLVLMFSVFILLLLLSMATFFDMDTIIKFLIGLPGGWMFRSPLKWQLYIPLVLATVLCLLLQRTPQRRIRVSAVTIISAAMVFMGLFLAVDIYRLLLRPRTFQQLAPLQAVNMEQKNLLFINDDDCFSYLQKNLRLVGELNQVLISKNVQVKRIKASRTDTINLGSYDYVFGCQSTLTTPLLGETRFKRTLKLADNHLELYENTEPRPYIHAMNELFTLNQAQNLSDKSTFAKEQLGQDFNFVQEAGDLPTTDLHDPFEAIKPEHLQDDKLVTQVWPKRGDQAYQLHARKGLPLFYKLDGNRVTLSGEAGDGLEPLQDEISLPPSRGRPLEFAYLDAERDHTNLIPNASLEEGLWEKDVWDCYAYDEEPKLHMNYNDKQKASGSKALELKSERHTACTGPADIKIKPGARYVLSFQYRSTGGPYAGFRVSFDDAQQTALSDRLPGGNGWQHFSREIEVPEEAKNLKLLVHAYANNAGAEGSVFYDDFSLIEIPNLQGRLYATSAPKPPATLPAISFDSPNPTQKRIHIRDAGSPFYLAMRDTYHPRWQATLAGAPLDSKQHVKINGYMNGWYLDPAALCQNGRAGCTANPDGTYNIELAATFTPQRWFYRGLAISGVTFAGVMAYFIYIGFRNRARGGRRYWRWPEN